MQRLLDHLNRLSLRRIAEVDARLADAMLMATEQFQDPALEKIEVHRTSMQEDLSPLADPSLGPPLSHDENLTIRDAVAASMPPRHARLLFALARVCRPKTAIELGTNVGISSAYIGSGLNDGRLLSLDVSRHRLHLAEALHRELGLSNVEFRQGLFAETLAPVLGELPPIEMAFIDGHHEYRATLDYFELINRHASAECLFVFDDIRWSAGMARAWRALRGDGRFMIAADFGRLGVCVMSAKPEASHGRTFRMRSFLG